MKALWIWSAACITVLVILTSLLVAPTRGQPAPAGARATWEYKALNRPTTGSPDAELNALGAQGWELVSAVCIPEGPSSASPVLQYVFKRAK